MLRLPDYEHRAKLYPDGASALSGLLTNDMLIARSGFGLCGLPERLDRNDVVGILEHIGADCAGAISCLPLGKPPVKRPGNLLTDHNHLTEENVIEIVNRLARGQALPDEGVSDDNV